MTLQNAIKKLNKAGFEVKKESYCFQAVKAGSERVIEFFLNGGREDDVICIKVRRKNDIDDAMTDYSAGFFCDNITQAIKFA